MSGYAHVRNGSKAALTAPKRDFRCSPETGHRPPGRPCPFSADFVAEVGIPTARDG